MPEITRALLTGQAIAWKRILNHPFVQRTSDGSLPRVTFDRWLTEDYFFVLSFRSFLEALAAVAPDEQAREVLAGGLAALVPELELFEMMSALRNDFQSAHAPAISSEPPNIGLVSVISA